MDAGILTTGEPLYRRARVAVLSRFLQRHSIYRTERFRAVYEASARANISRTIEKLRHPL